MTSAEIAAGLPDMVRGAEAIAAFLRAIAEKREPKHDIDEVCEWAEDLCADLATVEAALTSHE